MTDPGRRPGGAPEAGAPSSRRSAPDGALLPMPGPPPAGARTVAGSRRVRLGDVGPDGRVRLDAVARYLQDVAADDVREAGARSEHRWVVRRTTLEVRRRPFYEEPVEVVTWCSGTGAAWAERRTTVRGARGTCVEASALWVALDPETLRPGPLGQRFWACYASATAGRSVKGRLVLDPRPEPGATSRAWPLRAADFDALGHVNNAIAWAVLDEEVSRRLGVGPEVGVDARRVQRATVEYRAPVEAGAAGLEVRSTVAGDELQVWILDGTGSVAIVAVAGVGPTRPERADRRLS